MAEATTPAPAARQKQILAEGERTAIEAAAAAIDAADPWPVLSLATFELSRYAWRLEALVEDEADVAQALALIAGAAPALSPHWRDAPEADWIKLSLEGLPAVLAGRFAIAGAHAVERIAPGRSKIVIEASEAFGTGHHGTTRGCLLALDRLVRRRQRLGAVMDVGTGSGVLAIAAAKAGARRLWAGEIDPIAARHARANAVANRSRQIHVRRAAGLDRPELRAARPFDLIFANILFRPLVRLAPSLAAALRPGGRIVISGLLNAQAPLARMAYESRGLHCEERLRLEGWTTLVLRKSVSG